MTEKPDAPKLHFFRTTPREMLERPPLASSLQTLESCFFLIALSRFPHALVACATAWESALKASLSIPPTQFRELAKLLKDIREESAALDAYDDGKLWVFRDTRNRIAHYGFSPKDDQACAVLLFETGLPFLTLCYRELFDFYLDWRDIRPGNPDFHNLSPSEMEKAGLLPDVAEQLRLAFQAYSQAKELTDVDLTYCFRAFAHSINIALKDTHTSGVETRILRNDKIHWLRDEEVEKEKQALAEEFNDLMWTFNCPICGEYESLIAELDDDSLDSGQVHLLRCACVSCHFVVPHGAPFLTDLVLERQLQKQTPEILRQLANN